MASIQQAPDLYRNGDVQGTPTAIPGVVVVDLVVVPDGRGWARTVFDLDDVARLGLGADFAPTQWRTNFNEKPGVTRGIHAELCNKFVSVSEGVVWCAVVDLRRGDTFGRTELVTLFPGNAVFIPRGCGNSYQTQTPGAHYGYVNDRPLREPATLRVNLADPALAIPWPIALDEAVVLPEDRELPLLAEVTPLDLAATPGSAGRQPASTTKEHR